MCTYLGEVGVGLSNAGSFDGILELFGGDLTVLFVGRKIDVQ